MRLRLSRSLDLSLRSDQIFARYFERLWSRPRVSLKEGVHFYNTRDVLPRCAGPNDPGEKAACWPAAEVAANVDKTIGNLGLTAKEEDRIVAFLKTLTDDFKP